MKIPFTLSYFASLNYSFQNTFTLFCFCICHFKMEFSEKNITSGYCNIPHIIVFFAKYQSISCGIYIISIVPSQGILRSIITFSHRLHKNALTSLPKRGPFLSSPIITLFPCIIGKRKGTLHPSGVQVINPLPFVI